MNGSGDDSEKPDTPEKKQRDLTKSTIGHFLWMFAGSGAEAVLKVIVLLVLARLLTPAEFGIVGAALTIVNLAEITVRVGVAPSIVQTKTLTRDHIGTGLSVTIFVSFVIAAIVYLSAESIERLYRMAGLVPFIEVFAALFIIKGAGLVSEALLQRNLRFRQIATIRLFGYGLGSALVSITLAWQGFGAWSLVIGQLVHQSIMTIFYVYLARDKLTIGFKWSTFKSMFQFGFGVTLTQFGSYVSQNADFFIVGRYLGAEALGYYTRAYLLLQQAAMLVGRVGDEVLFPTLASVQDDRKRLQRALNQALSLVAMTQVPATALLVVMAPEIVLVLMGPQWDVAIAPFQILIAVLFFRTAYKFIGSILRAAGRVYIMAIWQWTYAVGVMAGAYFGQDYGLSGVSIGVSGAVIVCYFLGVVLVYTVVGVQTRSSLIRLFVYFVMAIAMAAILVAARAGLQNLGLGNLAILMLLSTGFVATYAGLMLATPRLFGNEGEVFRNQILKRLSRKGRSKKG